MQKKTLIKLGGFIGAAAVTATLVGFAANGTGAYFSDTKTGTIQASTGTIQVSTTLPANGVLDFTGLIPGEYKTVTFTYTAHTTDSTNGEDIWLVFPNDGSATQVGSSEAFEGNPDDFAGGGLGRYGHLQVSSTQGANFDSYNLSNPGTSAGHTGTPCDVDSNGEGGNETTPATSTSDFHNAFCAPNNILLAGGLTDSQGGTVTLTFGFTPLLSNFSTGTPPVYQQGGPVTNSAIEIVATQHGIKPGL